MQDRHITVFGNVVVGDVSSPDSGKPRVRVISCEVPLRDPNIGPALIDVYVWVESPPQKWDIAFLVGDMFAPADGEPVIFAETFTVIGQHSSLDTSSLFQVGLGVLTTGIVKGYANDDVILETGVYHRQKRTSETFDVIIRRPEKSARFANTTIPSTGSVFLCRCVLFHFSTQGLPVLLVDSFSYFSFQAASKPRPAIQTPGNAKRKSELNGAPKSNDIVLGPSTKKIKPDPPPFAADGAMAPKPSA